MIREIKLKDGGLEFGILYNSNGDFGIYSSGDDKDMLFQGSDGGAVITALTLDMSNAGRAVFNDGTTFNNNVYSTDNDKLIFGGGDDLKITKGQDLLTLYQYHTKVAEHYFCSKCGIHTHNKPRSNPKIYGINIACVEGINPFELENVGVNDGENHPLDQKK